MNTITFLQKIHGEIHHQPRYDKHPKFVVIGVLPQPNPDSEEIFRALASRNAINMHTDSFATAIVYDTDDSVAITGKLKKTLSEVGIK
jgi:hypothetical protein